MPEEIIRKLRCDAPGCDETGVYYRIEVDGRMHRVILGEKHAALLREVAGWGKLDRAPSPSRPKRSDRRGTDARRVLALVDVDQPEHQRG